MKNIFNSVLFLFLNITFSQTQFQKTDLVDEFGDKIGEVQRNISFGTFSNSATNDSSLKVHTFLNVNPDISYDDYKGLMIKELEKQNMSEKDIKKTLKYINEKTFNDFRNLIGNIGFDLYEYNEKKATFIEKSGIISIKTFEGKKISATFYMPTSGTIFLYGYKENSEDIKNRIKYNYYDWNQTEIYNEIVNAKGKTHVVIIIGNSNYNFTLE